ncbi:CyaY Protein implicated in iron transport, frataxin homolog [Burkholderiales bacterium]
MTESDYQAEIEAAFQWIENQADAWSEAHDLDLECHRTARVIELEFESGEKIVVNAQAPTQQLWLASRLGALHFVWEPGEGWRDTRGAGDFETVFCSHASGLAGLGLSLNQPR